MDIPSINMQHIGKLSVNGCNKWAQRCNKSLNGGAKVMELLSKGENNQSEIASILQVDKSIICRDIAYLRQQAKENIKKYIDERLPEEYEKCLIGLTD